MTEKIQVIRKKNKQVKIVDPLAKQKLIWTIGHSLTLVCGLIFSITYFFHVSIFFKYRSWKWLFLRVNKDYSFLLGERWFHTIVGWTPQILYRIALFGIVLSNSVTMHQNWSRLNPTWFDLFAADNFQALMVATLWLLAGGKSFYRLLPFLILSYMHLTNRKNEFDTNPTVSFDEVTLNNKRLLHTLAYTEIIVIFALLLDTLLMKKGSSGFLFVIYTSIYWIKINFSAYAQVTIIRILGEIDHKIPAKHREKWESVKNFLYVKIRERSERNEKAIRY